MSTEKQTAGSEPSTPARVFLARLFWFFFGPIALGLIAYQIARSGTGWATPLDVAFLTIMVLMIGARWYELWSGRGQDGYGKPATLAAFPKYAGGLISIALAVWVAANLLGNHVLD
jgi:hypothetical protein